VDAEVVLLKAQVSRAKVECLSHDGTASASFHKVLGDGSGADLRGNGLLQGAVTVAFGASKIRPSHCWSCGSADEEYEACTSNAPAHEGKDGLCPPTRHNGSASALLHERVENVPSQGTDANSMQTARAELVMDEFRAQRARSFSPDEFGASSKQQQPTTMSDSPVRTVRQRELVSPILAGHEQVLIAFEPSPGQHGPQMAVHLLQSINSLHNEALVLTLHSGDHSCMNRTHGRASRFEVLEGIHRSSSEANLKFSMTGLQNGVHAEESELKRNDVKSEMERYHVMRRRLEAYRQTLHRCKMK
jgi:hypothetical protein